MHSARLGEEEFFKTLGESEAASSSKMEGHFALSTSGIFEAEQAVVPSSASEELERKPITNKSILL